MALLTKAVQEGVAARFEKAKTAQSADINAVEARRHGVHAYVEFIHCTEAIYNAAASQTEGEVVHHKTEMH